MTLYFDIILYTLVFCIEKIVPSSRQGEGTIFMNMIPALSIREMLLCVYAELNLRGLFSTGYFYGYIPGA